MVQGPSVYVLPEPDVVWMYMTSAKISRIKNFANVGITAKSAKILLRENFPLYGINVSDVTAPHHDTSSKWPFFNRQREISFSGGENALQLSCLSNFSI